MDSRLSHWTDDDGQVWQICQVCTQPTRHEDLAPAQTEGVRWNVCIPCKQREENQS